MKVHRVLTFQMMVWQQITIYYTINKTAKNSATAISSDGNEVLPATALETIKLNGAKNKNYCRQCRGNWSKVNVDEHR